MQKTLRVNTMSMTSSLRDREAMQRLKHSMSFGVLLKIITADCLSPILGRTANN